MPAKAGMARLVAVFELRCRFEIAFRSVVGDDSAPFDQSGQYQRGAIRIGRLCICEASAMHLP